MNTSSKSFEHVSRISKSVDRETETHQHDEHADQSERDFGPRVTCWLQYNS